MISEVLQILCLLSSYQKTLFKKAKSYIFIEKDEKTQLIMVGNLKSKENATKVKKMS